MRIRKTPEEYLISVRNRVQEDLLLEEGKLPGTTKKESGHGMGLANVQDVLRKYGAESVSYTHLDVYKRQVHSAKVDAHTPQLGILCGTVQGQHPGSQLGGTVDEVLFLHLGAAAHRPPNPPGRAVTP